MKDEILKILDTTIYYSDITEGVKAADELQRLMCYREVSAMINVPSYYNGPHYYWVIQLLKGSYPESLIQEAIEKVKNEQK